MIFTLNGQRADAPAEWSDESLLFLLREHFGLTGAKFGCGVGLCGACTVIVDGVAQRACIVPVATVEHRTVRTVEGLAHDRGLHPVQAAWLDAAVPQCGYCQAGQIMAAVALLERDPRPTPAAIEAALAGNLCRCGTYGRIRTAVAKAAETA